MNKFVKKFAAVTTIGFLGAASLSPAMAIEVEPNSGSKVMKSLAIQPVELEKSSKTGVMSVVTTIAKEVKPEEVKGLFNTIKQKTQDELDEIQAKTTKKPGFWKSFWVGFKHGFIETLKAGVKLLIKAAPAIIAMI